MSMRFAPLLFVFAIAAGCGREGYSGDDGVAALDVDAASAQTGSCRITPSAPTAGSPYTATGSALAPGKTIRARVQDASGEVNIDAIATAAGTATWTFTSARAGEAELRLYEMRGDNRKRVATCAFNVLAGGAPEQPEEPSEPEEPTEPTEPTEPLPPGALIGWAGEEGLGLRTTTGGGALAPRVVTTAAELSAALSNGAPTVIEVSGSITGDFTVGSNTTLQGRSGAVVHGHLDLHAVSNVIIRNLSIVGYNCADTDDCQGGADAITVNKGSHHLWFDHLDISDGSDGNLDITQASDFVTVSWTKFHYSARRDASYDGAPHKYSNLIGASDSQTADRGHLRVTFHHVWWADNVVERMPRVRFGKVHVFNSLYTARGNSSVVGLGVEADVLSENNVFVGVANPYTLKDDGEAILTNRGNVYVDVTGDTGNRNSGGFDPPYAYTLEATSGLEATIRAGVGPR